MMRAVIFLWFSVALSLFSRSEAGLRDLREVNSKPTDLSALNLEKRMSKVWKKKWRGCKGLYPEWKKIVKAIEISLNDRNFSAIYPGADTRKLIEITSAKMIAKDSPVIRKINLSTTRRANIINLSVEAPRVDVIAETWYETSYPPGSQVAAITNVTIDTLTINLRSYWSKEDVSRLVHATVDEFEFGTINVKNSYTPTVPNLRLSTDDPFWQTILGMIGDGLIARFDVDDLLANLVESILE